MKQQKVKNTIFYITIALIPVGLVIFRQIFINLNSILMAFEQFGVADGMLKVSFAGFKNFADVINAIKTDHIFLPALKRSVIIYFFSLFFTTILPVVFTYYLYKKNWGHGVFKVILFLPSVIPGIAMVIIFKILADMVYPKLMMDWFSQEVFGLLVNRDTKFPTVLAYNLWINFGAGMLVSLASMNSVDKNVVEAGKLDGISYFGELWHIVLPKSYTVIALGFITGISGIFTSDFGLYAFYGENADSTIETLGYYFLVETKRATDVEYGFLSAWGLLMSIIAIPLTFFARWVINKFGPSED